jgi:hypothetical protein
MVLECVYCEYKTEDRRNYTRHIKTDKHNNRVAACKPITSVESKSIKKLKCEYCGDEFGRRQSLSRHRLYRCNKVNKKEEL